MARLLSLIPAVILVVAGLPSLAGSGTATSVRTFALPGHGKLELTVPNSWIDSIHSAGPELPPSIRFSPSKGQEFELLITPLWGRNSEARFDNPPMIRAIVEAAGRSVLERSVEKQLSLAEIRGKRAHGYAFSLTDGAAAPGEYEYLTQGAAGMGELLITFTILTHRQDARQIRQALDMIRSSRQVP